MSQDNTNKKPDSWITDFFKNHSEDPQSPLEKGTKETLKRLSKRAGATKNEPRKSNPWDKGSRGGFGAPRRSGPRGG